MTTEFHDTLAYLDVNEAEPSFQLSGEPSKRPNPLQLKQKRSLGGYAVGAHLHRQFDQLLICERGAGSILLDDCRHEFQAPAVLVVPSLTLHSLSFDENSERWVVSIGKDYFQALKGRTPEFAEIMSRVRCIQFEPHDREYLELQHVLDKLEWEQRRNASCHEIIIEALLIDLLVGVFRKIQDREPEEASEQDIHVSFTRLVEEHHTENWTLQQFADTLGVSVARLRSACHSVSGESPIKIINTRILLAAKRYLTHMDLSVSEVACRLGFEDASYFSRFFKSRCGQTPSDYKATKKDNKASLGG